MDVARIKWTGKRGFLGTDEAGHSVMMDAKAEYKGDGSGIRPVELVLHGLAGCTGMDVISILEKKRQDIRGLEIVVHGRQRTEEYPKIYDRITVEFIVTGYGVKPDAVKRAIELSEEKYCSVKGMFGPQVEVETTFSVVEAPAPGSSVQSGESE
ncbi:MAG: osmotically inducible protein OsmC [Actinobacteria bacterium HGW-Actinobacteria-7]|nr:MAG: osmotically inducible protein OsmC [Actinobacteria bacterium HGW-Actinobacteria-7]